MVRLVKAPVAARSCQNRVLTAADHRRRLSPAARMAEGLGLPSAGPRRERLLPLQVHHWRWPSRSESRWSGGRGEPCLPRPESDDRAWQARVVRDQSVTSRGLGELRVQCRAMHHALARASVYYTGVEDAAEDRRPGTCTPCGASPCSRIAATWPEVSIVIERYVCTSAENRLNRLGAQVSDIERALPGLADRCHLVRSRAVPQTASGADVQSPANEGSGGHKMRWAPQKAEAAKTC